MFSPQAVVDVLWLLSVHIALKAIPAPNTACVKPDKYSPGADLAARQQPEAFFVEEQRHSATAIEPQRTER